MRFSWQVYWGGLPFPPPADHVLSELSAMTHPSWVALHGMAHSFTELHKLLHHDKAVILGGDHDKGLYMQGYDLPRVMYSSESWTIKKAECQRIDVFELWCWRRLLKVPWTARRSNQSILREINPEYSLEGLMLKLMLQYFGHLMRTDDSVENSLMRGKIEGEEEERIRG